MKVIIVVKTIRYCWNTKFVGAHITDVVKVDLKMQVGLELTVI